MPKERPAKPANPQAKMIAVGLIGIGQPAFHAITTEAAAPRNAPARPPTKDKVSASAKNCQRIGEQDLDLSSVAFVNREVPYEKAA